MHLFVGCLRLLGGEQAAHNLAYDHGRGLEHLLVGGLLAGDAEVAAKLIFQRAVHLISGNLSCCHVYLHMPCGTQLATAPSRLIGTGRGRTPRKFGGYGHAPQLAFYFAPYTLLPLGRTSGRRGEPDSVTSGEIKASLSEMT